MEAEVEHDMKKIKNLKVVEDISEVEISEQDKIPGRLEKMLGFKGIKIKDNILRRVGG